MTGLLSNLERASSYDLVFKQDPIDVLGLQVKNGYVFERGKCKVVSKTSLNLFIWESPRKFLKSMFADTKIGSKWGK